MQQVTVLSEFMDATSKGQDEQEEKFVLKIKDMKLHHKRTDAIAAYYAPAMMKECVL